MHGCSRNKILQVFEKWRANFCRYANIHAVECEFSANLSPWFRKECKNEDSRSYDQWIEYTVHSTVGTWLKQMSLLFTLKSRRLPTLFLKSSKTAIPWPISNAYKMMFDFEICWQRWLTQIRESNKVNIDSCGKLQFAVLCLNISYSA